MTHLPPDDDDLGREQRTWGDAPLGQIGRGGGGNPPGGGEDGRNLLEARVTALETHHTYLRRDLDNLNKALEVLPQLATKGDLETWRGQWLLTGIGIVALVVGGVVGGLALINKTVDHPVISPPPPPVIMQLPVIPSATPK
jgi:hypothetical protein